MHQVLTHNMRRQGQQPSTSYHCDELQLLPGKKLADNRWCDLPDCAMV